MSTEKLLGALEAGGTKMVCAVGYEDGTIVERTQIPTSGPDDCLAPLVDWFAQRDIAALGIGAFGPTAVNPASPDYGHILQTPKIAWRGFDLLGGLQRALEVPCGYDTDVNVACLGESVFGCGRGLDSLVYLTIGTGVGAGIMLDGKLIHGAMHPEAGHVLVTPRPSDPLAQQGACPSHACCLEGLIAGPAIAKRWDGKTAGDIADDAEAMDLLADYLGQALMTYTLCYSPQRIIIGGGVADHTPIVELARAKTASYLNGYIDIPEVRAIDTYIVGNSLDGNQGILGCLELAKRTLATA